MAQKKAIALQAYKDKHNAALMKQRNALLQKKKFGNRRLQPILPKPKARLQPILPKSKAKPALPGPGEVLDLTGDDESKCAECSDEFSWPEPGHVCPNKPSADKTNKVTPSVKAMAAASRELGRAKAGLKAFDSQYSNFKNKIAAKLDRVSPAKRQKFDAGGPTVNINETSTVETSALDETSDSGLKLLKNKLLAGGLVINKVSK